MGAGLVAALLNGGGVYAGSERAVNEYLVCLSDVGNQLREVNEGKRELV